MDSRRKQTGGGIGSDLLKIGIGMLAGAAVMFA